MVVSRRVRSTTDIEIVERAANGYVVWPLAVLAIFRELPGATAWSRLHARQAFVFGLSAGFAYLVVLALPLLAVSIFPTLSTGAILWLYALGFLADAAGAMFLVMLAFRYRARALRGELFAIPLVTPIADRFLHLERE
jgi:uncharacterized membrane protein